MKYVVAEIRKTYQNAAKECLMWYYRDKAKKEADLVMESDGALHPMEIKKGINPGNGLVCTDLDDITSKFPGNSPIDFCAKIQYPFIRIYTGRDYVLPQGEK